MINLPLTEDLLYRSKLELFLMKHCLDYFIKNYDEICEEENKKHTTRLKIIKRFTICYNIKEYIEFEEVI